MASAKKSRCFVPQRCRTGRIELPVLWTAIRSGFFTANAREVGQRPPPRFGSLLPLDRVSKLSRPKIRLLKMGWKLLWFRVYF